MKVPFFNYSKIFKEDESKILEIVSDIIRRGAYILQQDLIDFETSIAEYLGAKYCIGVGNATDGLWMLCRAAGLKEGDEAIFCSHTMIATASGIYFTGATPVPCETGWDHEMDAKSAEKLLTPRTKAIVPTQLNGRCCNMDAILDLCQRKGLMLLEDSAQALGAKYKGQYAGLFGKGGILSFYPSKTLGAMGDGGCVITNDEEIYKKVSMFRDFGRNAKQEAEYWCLNSRLDNMQAAVLNYRFQKYDSWINRRREIAALYHSQLADVTQLVLPPAPDSDPDYYDIFQNYEIEAENRNDLVTFLRQNNIGTLIQWGGTPVHKMTKLGFTQSLPYTENFFEHCVMLPMNHVLTDEEVIFVCKKIKEFYCTK
ncbi:MAG: DegT/DnrJ/EryC1/StrS family aminotransferase [Planctomycetaceae bacterium]|jgi:dTDP-4-amino-4,6-dideoxygalactose transaminase|nr:DegT/DnrJ/EryC1/StrS family aminotransferase [Planctomycetaceae bacterium]